MRYFLKLSFFGKDFHGWQRQINAYTVQQCLEEALAKILGHSIDLVGAGRTDTGVHARLYYAHFDSSIDNLETDITFLKGLNAILPFSIAVQNIIRVHDNAHARFDATSRTYQYLIVREKNPFLTDFAWNNHHKLNISLMNDAAQLLLKHTDFESFAKLHSDVDHYNCEIMHADWKLSEDCLIFEIKANRFLRNMVRAITGTLIEVGRERITSAEFENIILKRDRKAAGMSVPANGLYLTFITYPFL